LIFVVDIKRNGEKPSPARSRKAREVAERVGFKQVLVTVGEGQMAVGILLVINVVSVCSEKTL
jgi:hypothetical protein